MEFDPLDNDRVFAGSPCGGLWYSENQGESWVSGGTDHLPVIGVSHFQMGRDQSEKEFWFIATGDGGSGSGGRYHGNICESSMGVWRSEDMGQSWQDVCQNISGKIDLPNSGAWSLLIRKILIHPLDNNILFACTNIGLYKTTNALDAPGNVSWTRVFHSQNDIATGDTDPPGAFYDIQFKPDGNYNTLLVTAQKVYVSTQNGDAGTWSLLPNFNGLNKTNNRQMTISMSVDDSDILYMAYAP
ncbi:MAG: hypothetical protein LAT54_08800, partial [Cryomorphaceae bacterium]|nr:hypothetical protein [Cryomorphaceae bacterium]